MFAALRFLNQKVCLLLTCPREQILLLEFGTLRFHILSIHPKFFHLNGRSGQFRFRAFPEAFQSELPERMEIPRSQKIASELSHW